MQDGCYTLIFESLSLPISIETLSEIEEAAWFASYKYGTQAVFFDAGVIIMLPQYKKLLLALQGTYPSFVKEIDFQFNDLFTLQNTLKTYLKNAN